MLSEICPIYNRVHVSLCLCRRQSSMNCSGMIPTFIPPPLWEKATLPRLADCFMNEFQPERIYVTSCVKLYAYYTIFLTSVQVPPLQQHQKSRQHGVACAITRAGRTI